MTNVPNVMPNAAASKEFSLRAIPSIDRLLRTDAATQLRSSIGMERLTVLGRQVIEEMRGELQSTGMQEQPAKDITREALLEQAVQRLQNECQRDSAIALRRVINATGVILHTNLGRAPLSDAARNALANEAAGYCTLEYDSATGARGKRGARVEKLLAELTRAESALVVNNCASAALLILTVLAGNGDTIVSRGELVEIGGDFRVPDVMANSGTRMMEVGTTNCTRLDDYRRAINEKTRLIMRVHPSNYRVVGFTSSPTLSELASLAHDSELFLYEDAGSGALMDLTDYGLKDEPAVGDCISGGADIVSFSGDKLLGSVQAGLIVGRREIIDRLRKHSLYRALRADKLRLAALEVTLDSLRRGASFSEIPALRMLALTKEAIEERAKHLIQRLSESAGSSLKAALLDGESAIGGGSGPTSHPPTALVALEDQSQTAEQIEKKLRFSSPPVVARIANDRVLLDLRTVAPGEEPELLAALSSLKK